MMMCVPVFRFPIATHQCLLFDSFKVQSVIVPPQRIGAEIKLCRPSHTFPSAKVILMVILSGNFLSRSQLAMVFTADFKLGHYMKVPPRVMFFGQIMAILVAGTVQLGVQAW